MPCYNPTKAFKCADGSIVFVELKRYDIVGDIKVPCGQCIGCRIDRSREWAVRCLHESKLHEHNSFITLTYNDENLPASRSLEYGHFQAFMKRLRKRVGEVRFFMCGEYGEIEARPHYHALLFGYQFPDLQYWGKSPSGHPVYRSALLEDLWKYGNSLVGSVSRESAGYVARYCMKKVTGDLAEEHYRYVAQDGTVYDRVPEFARMSLRPGIGAEWFTRYESDMLPNDYCVVDGVKAPVPRYYDKLHKRNGGDIETVKERRTDFGLAQRANNTDERLEARKAVAEARIQQLVRKI